MHTPAEHAKYLDRLLSAVWASAHPLIGDRAVHEIAIRLPGVASLDAVDRLVMHIKPQVDALPGDRLRIRLPAPGAFAEQYYEFHLDLNNSFSATALVRLWAEVAAAGADWHSDVDVDTGTPWWAVLLLGPLSTIPFEVVDEVLAGGQEGELLRQLGQLKEIVYDRSAPLGPPGLKPELVHGAFGGDLVGADHVDWLDLVFVADNYTASDIGEFHSAVDTATKKLTTASGDPGSALFVAHRSVLRTWKLPLERAGSATAERLMGAVSRPGGGSVTSLSNLARLAEAGLMVEDALGHEFPTQSGLSRPPVIVILQRGETGVMLPRASAWGGLILLPVKPSPASAGTSAHDEMARTLVHELGHALGGLADEYGGIGASYQGPEPAAPNVSKNASTATKKWAKWLSAPAAGVSNAVSVGNVGGYEFNSGILRPSPTCKMNDSRTDIAFCPVCQDALTTGLVRHLGYQDQRVIAPVVVEVTYLSPWTGPAREYVLPARIGAGQPPVSLALDVLEATDPNDPVPTVVQIVAKRAALPEFAARLSAVHSDGSVDTTSPPDVVSARPGTRATLVVSSGPTSALSSDLRALTQVVAFSFENVRTITLEHPFDLAQNVAVGARIEPILDIATGDFSLGLELSARAGGVPGWSLPTSTEFMIAGPGAPVTLARTDHGGHGTPLTYIPAPLPAGVYEWRARTLLARSSMSTKYVQLPLGGHRGHFRVLPYPARPESPPVAPFDLAVSLRFDVIPAPGYATGITAGGAIRTAARTSSATRHLPGLGSRLRAGRLREPLEPLEPTLPPGGPPGGVVPPSPGGVPPGVPTPPHTVPPGAPGGTGPVPFPGEVVRWLDLAASSYDVNADALRFEFEVVPMGQAFTGKDRITTALVQPDGVTTLRVQGVVSVSAEEDVAWRVRAVDEHGNQSPWTQAVSPRILPMWALDPSPR